MKIQSKLTVIGSIAALVASPLALAGPSTPDTSGSPVVVVTPDAPEVIVDHAAPPEKVTDEEPANDGGKADDGDKGGEVVVADPTDEADHAGKDDGGVPIDWVKRGGGDNPDVIFYNMAGGGEPPVFKGETTSTLSRELGKDDKAADIEAKGNSATPAIKSEKKEPVALIKKGRVFLR